MRKWVLLLGGFIVWAVHFFLLYGFASIFPGTQLAKILSWVATVPALAADALLLWAAAARTLIAKDHELDAWVLNVAALGAGFSFVAILWQALPAALV